MAKIEMNRTVTTTMENLAASLAKRASKEVTGTVENFLVHKAESKGGPIRVMLALKNNYGEDMAEFPKPNTETGNKPEYFMVESVRNGTAIKKRMSFYTLFYRDTAEGKRNLQTLEHIATYKAAQRDPKIDDSDVPEIIKDMNEEQLDDLQRTTKNREVNASAAYRNAMALAYKLEEINELDGVEAAIRFEDKEETKPIIGEGSIVVRDATDNTKYKFYSVSAFLLLNADKASENGGTFKALKESVNREGAGHAKGVPVVATLDTFKKGIIGIEAYAAKMADSSLSEQYANLLKELGPKGPQGSDDFALTMYNLYTFMDQIYQNEAVKKRALKLFTEDGVTDKAA